MGTLVRLGGRTTPTAARRGKHDRAAQHVQADLGGRRGPVQKSPEQIRTGQNSSKQLRTQFRTVLTVQNSPNSLNSSDQS